MNRRYEQASAVGIKESAEICRELVTVHIPRVRSYCDAAEKLVPSRSWPLPTYSEMLYKQ